MVRSAGSLMINAASENSIKGLGNVILYRFWSHILAYQRFPSISVRTDFTPAASVRPRVSHSALLFLPQIELSVTVARQSYVTRAS